MNLPQPSCQEGEDSFGRPAVLEAITLALDHEDSHSDRDSGGVRRMRAERDKKTQLAVSIDVHLAGNGWRGNRGYQALERSTGEQSATSERRSWETQAFEVDEFPPASWPARTCLARRQHVQFRVSEEAEARLYIGESLSLLKVFETAKDGRRRVFQGRKCGSAQSLLTFPRNSQPAKAQARRTGDNTHNVGVPGIAVSRVSRLIDATADLDP
ncbi:hypothetical protein CFIO01_01758 [Colletotrichum fioriniae PJ7]|uniref:Uncharacterized protein n=1 Tax=Colletotrichum fioriniae PJ7 TaxID=1445577 RepID=A0A010RA87_9PEZI|nr:hypothetical protein CFIO01_01758 [Colletotrichum fioriniae PJ7]